MNTLTQRVLVSFDDLCPYQCKHCFTLDIPRNEENRTIDQILDSMASKDFDIVYVSQKRENFIDPVAGIDLCERIYARYKCNIFVITRTVMSNFHLQRLKQLKSRMSLEGKHLIIGVSVFATHSYVISENPNCVSSPYERMNFLKKLSIEGFYTVTLIRPVFPSEMVPIKELYEIVELCKENKHNSVVSSGLAVNKNILWRLGINADDLKYIKNARYLEGAMEGPLNFVNVSDELALLREYCTQENVPFFEHTMAALNYLIESTSIGE